MSEPGPGFDFSPEKSKDVTIDGDVISKSFGQSFRGAEPVKENAGRGVQGIFKFESRSHKWKYDCDAI